VTQRLCSLWAPKLIGPFECLVASLLSTKTYKDLPSLQ
jgi:hypothetical protein